MATSGYVDVRLSKWDTLRFSWSLSSQSIAHNTSTVAWKLELVAGEYGYLQTLASKYWLVTVDSNEYSGQNSIGVDNNQTKVLASGSTVIGHDADGSKTFSFSFEQSIDIVFNGDYIDTLSGSGNGVLPDIPQASQPSLVTWPETTNNVGAFGETFSIHMNRASSNFTHTVRYEYGKRSGVIAEGVDTGTTWAVPLEFMNDVPNVTSASGRIYVDTYTDSGKTLVGTKYTGFTVTVPISVKPTCTMTLEDVTGIDDIYGSPVQGLSRIKVTVKPTLAYSSPIASYTINANGVNYSAAEITTEPLKTAGTSRVTVTVKDTRGRTGTAYYDMNVQENTAPRVSTLTVGRCDEDGTENDQGEYCRVVFSALISSMSGKNTAQYTLRYKKSSATTWTQIELTELNNVYDVTSHLEIFAADGNSSYDVEIIATDRHYTEVRSTSVSTAFTLFNCHPSGTGWRFGGVAEDENTLQNDLALHQVGNTYAFQPSAFEGAKGYTLLATINLTALNVNAPIVFIINRRGALCPMTVYARFASSSTSLDPDLASFTYDGDNFGAFMVKTATSTWRLYVDNTSGWSNPCLQSWYTTENQKSRLQITFTHEQVDGTNPNVLGTYYRAVPAKMQSILDYVYPVGSIYFSYSHVSPGDLFGGTWVRLENTFLWAVDEDGAIGQTGGSKTHTLTVDELPSHSHGSVYSQHAAGTKDRAWYSTTGTSMAYGAVATGGGAAHNNMPPYTQVSVWRRTA